MLRVRTHLAQNQKKQKPCAAIQIGDDPPPTRPPLRIASRFHILFAHEAIPGSFFSQGQAGELSGPFHLQTQGIGQKIPFAPPQHEGAGSRRGSGVVGTGRGGKSGSKGLGSGLRSPSHRHCTPVCNVLQYKTWCHFGTNA